MVSCEAYTELFEKSRGVGVDSEQREPLKKDYKEPEEPYKLETEVVEIERGNRKNECAVVTKFGKLKKKSLWDTGAGKSVCSKTVYNEIDDEFKSPLRPSPIKIRAANQTYISNLGECTLKFRLGREEFTYDFLVSDGLGQDIILGYNFASDHLIGTIWDQEKRMWLTKDGRKMAPTLNHFELNSIVTVAENTLIPAYSNAKVVCQIPAFRRRETKDRQCLFEPSNKHQANFSDCSTWPGVVTMDDSVVKTGKFCVTMTNKTNRIMKVRENLTIGLLKTIDEGTVTHIHRICTFDRCDTSLEGEGESETLKGKEPKVEELYHIPVRNAETGMIENVTVTKEQNPPKTLNEIGINEDFVEFEKLPLKDASISQSTKKALDKLLKKNEDAFATDERTIGTTPLITMNIDTGDAVPVAKRPYNTALKHRSWIDEELDKLMEAGVIRESMSSWSAPVLVVAKGDGGKRLVVDYRGLNNVTRTFVWPMPRVEDILAKLGGAKFFTTFDLRAGYHHIALAEDSIPKTSFVTYSGKYEYLKVPFGLAQAPAYFQKLMNKVLKGLDFCMAYLDDIIIFSKTEEEHLHHIEVVLERLKEAQLKLKKSKCEFFKEELYYLGHVLTTEGVKPQLEKVKAILEMLPPRDAKGVRSFLGSVGYYRKFIHKFAEASKFLTKLTKKGAKFVWLDEHQKAFDYLRMCLTKDTILKYPDPKKKYIMYTDASDYAASAVLCQEHPDPDGKMMDMPVAYLSTQFSDTQFKWSTIVKEGYAIYYANKKWRSLLEGREILLKSDAKALLKFLSGKTENLKLDRWSVELQDRGIKLEHIPGNRNCFADCLSRLPFEVRKRVDDPLLDIEVAHVEIQEVSAHNIVENCCPVCVEDRTNTVAMQAHDTHCIRIKKLLADPKSTFGLVRDSYGLEENGLLHRKVVDKGVEYKATVVPKVLVPTVMKEMHDHFGHFGVGKTYAWIKRHYFWPKMIRTIQSYIASCTLCRQEKLREEPYQSQDTGIPKKAFDKVSLDLIVELPESYLGNKHILVMIDHFTSWPIAVAIPNKEAITVANAVYDELFCEHGRVNTLLADNGSEFTNDTLKFICDTVKTRQTFASPHTPRSNGKTENFNKFLKATLRKLCQGDQRTWDQVLKQVVLAYRSCPHTCTGESPFTLLKGWDPCLPIHDLIQPVPRYNGNNELGHRIEKQRIAMSIAAKMLKKMRANQRRTTEHRRSVHNFKAGDLVLFKNHTALKFDRRWEPNYRIVKLTSGWSARIVNIVTGRERRCNVSHLHLKLPEEDWNLLPESIGRPAKFVNHPDNLPDVDFKPELDQEVDPVGDPKSCQEEDSDPKEGTQVEDLETEKNGKGHNLRRHVKAPVKLDL